MKRLIINVNAERVNSRNPPNVANPARSSVSSLSFASLFPHPVVSPGFSSSCGRGMGKHPSCILLAIRIATEEEGRISRAASFWEDTSALTGASTGPSPLPLHRWFSSKLAVFVSTRPTLGVKFSRRVLRSTD